MINYIVSIQFYIPFKRLFELLEDELQFGINETEIFILCASAYLHDIGRPKNSYKKGNGKYSANMITSDDSLKFLFPSSDIRNQVAKICDLHDREIKNLETGMSFMKRTVKNDRWYKFEITFKNTQPNFDNFLS